MVGVPALLWWSGPISRIAGSGHRAEDATAGGEDVLIRLAGYALPELGGPPATEQQVRVRVDEAG